MNKVKAVFGNNLFNIWDVEEVKGMWKLLWLIEYSDRIKEAMRVFLGRARRKDGANRGDMYADDHNYVWIFDMRRVCVDAENCGGSLNMALCKCNQSPFMTLLRICISPASPHDFIIFLKFKFFCDSSPKVSLVL